MSPISTLNIPYRSARKYNLNRYHIAPIFSRHLSVDVEFPIDLSVTEFIQYMNRIIVESPMFADEFKRGDAELVLFGQTKVPNTSNIYVPPTVEFAAHEFAAHEFASAIVESDESMKKVFMNKRCFYLRRIKRDFDQPCMICLNDKPLERFYKCVHECCIECVQACRLRGMNRCAYCRSS